MKQTSSDHELYPVCVFLNTAFFQKFEEGLIVAKSILRKTTPEKMVIESVLKCLSEYKKSKPEEEPEAPIERFTLLPEEECNYCIGFNPLSNAPIEAMFFSLKDIQNITNAFQLAKRNAPEKKKDPVNYMCESFSDFLNGWLVNAKQTGSYFGERRRIQ